MIQISVAICTYNGAERLPKVLDRLKAQVYPEDLKWEVIVVDNNSTDRTVDIVYDYQRQWPHFSSLRYEIEKKQGLAHARQRAVNEAHGEWIGFLDDDNLPTSNWLVAAREFSQTHPQAGVIGSRILGCYEGSPPKGFERISRFLAINTSRTLVCYSNPSYASYRKQIYPPGAGVVINRQAWLDTVPEVLTLQGRVSGLCLPGEDVEAFIYLRRAGWDIWYNPAMVIEHLIPKQRLESPYLYKLLWQTGLSRYQTRRLAYSGRFYWLIMLLYGFNDILKLLKHCWRYSLLPKDVVSKAERLMLIGGLASPFFFLKIFFLNKFKKYL